jgi:hypothetical protein
VANSTAEAYKKNKYKKYMSKVETESIIPAFTWSPNNAY